MLFFFTLITHLLIIFTGLLLLGGVIFLAIQEGIHNTDAAQETVLRILSIGVALLLYVAGTALGISIPELLVRAIGLRSIPVTLLIGAALPFVIGLVAARYITAQLRKGDDITVRTILIAIVFVLVLFTDSYAKSFGSGVSNSGYNQSLLPNVTFALAVSSYAVFNVRRKGEGR